MNKVLSLLFPLPVILALGSLAAILLQGSPASPLLPALLSGSAALASALLMPTVRLAAAKRELAWEKEASSREEALKGSSAAEARLKGALASLAAAFGSRRGEEELGAALASFLSGDAGVKPEDLAALAARGKAQGASGDDHVAEALVDARMVLPLARKIVAAVPGKTEEATMVLIERFTEVRELSSKAAEASKDAIRHMDGGEGAESFQARAFSTKKAIEAERKAVLSMVENNRQNARKLQAMSKELASGIELINGIEEITERARLIAFNMAVEAARLGEKGRGFKVIVGELHALNDRTQEFSGKVAELLGRYREYSASLVTGMAISSEQLSGEVMGVMTEAGEAVESLIGSSTTMGELSARLAGLVKDVDRDLDGVLEALQFQDITRQMLEGSIRIIEDAEARLALAGPLLAAIGGGDEKAARARFEAIRKGFVAEAKTKDEKQAMMEVLA